MFQRVVICILAAIVLSLPARATPGTSVLRTSQPGTLHLVYVTYSDNGTPAGLREFFEQFHSELCRRNTTFAQEFPLIDFRTVRYNDPVDAFSKEATFSILTPLKFVQYKEHLGSKILPVMIATKGPSHSPYYSAVFIAAESSNIETLDSPDIRTIYMLKSGSLSGHIAPLVELNRLGLIRNPTPEALAQHKWDVVECEDHNKLIDAVAHDPNAIGCTWTKAAFRGVRPILRYGAYTQDVISISSDLKEFEQDLIQAFNSALAARAAAITSSSPAPGTMIELPYLEINGTVRYSPEHANSLSTIKALYNAPTAARPCMNGLAVFVATVLLACLSVRILLSTTLKDPNAGMRQRIDKIWRLSWQTLADGLLASFIVVLPIMLIPSAASVRLLLTRPPDWLSIIMFLGAGVFLGLLIAGFSVVRYLIEEGPRLVRMACDRYVGGAGPRHSTEP